MNGKLEYVFVIAIALYLLSLALPAIVYQPSKLNNPKLEECRNVNNSDFQCETFAFGKGSPNKLDICGTEAEAKAEHWVLIDKQKIIDYCAGYDQPVGSIDYGYFVLLWGIFDSTFAWPANFLALLAAFCASARTLRAHVAGMVLSLIAFLVGFNSFNFATKFLDEGGVNRLQVDHLGVGFYVWELSFLVLAIYFCLRVLVGRRSAATSQASPTQTDPGDS